MNAWKEMKSEHAEIARIYDISKSSRGFFWPGLGGLFDELMNCTFMVS